MVIGRKIYQVHISSVYVTSIGWLGRLAREGNQFTQNWCRGAIGASWTAEAFDPKVTEPDEVTHGVAVTDDPHSSVQWRQPEGVSPVEAGEDCCLLPATSRESLSTCLIEL